MNKQTYHRYRTIDGIRGLAALSVVFFHLSIQLTDELYQLFPYFINLAFSYGYLGVPVFFVISGFVISLSIGSNTITPKYFGNFVLRRSIRLDPTYWASILIAIVLMYIKKEFVDPTLVMPDSYSVFTHMFYLQDILSVTPAISVIYWTLCLEVQLYLFYIISLWVAQKAVKKIKVNLAIFHQVLVFIIGLISVAINYKTISLPVSGLFLPYWHYFLLGVMVSNIIKGAIYSKVLFLLFLVLEFSFLGTSIINTYAITGLVTSTFILTLWRYNLLDSVFTSKTLLFLGEISYTLYLIHPDIGWKVISIGKLIFKDNMTPSIGGLLLLIGILISIFCAYILHLLVEKPTLRLCNRLKLKRPLIKKEL
ncbi:MAG: peptidoglycan/LPS O-acetylase OafA/YrhL [Colwellia sp.]|jgi:peptidoglycan/LPS O-acetylase OafA/YrhL